MFEKRRVATEWDMGWFCCKCECLKHWKTEAYILHGRYYCKECYEKTFKKPIDKSKSM